MSNVDFSRELCSVTIGIIGRVIRCCFFLAMTVHEALDYYFGQHFRISTANCNGWHEKVFVVSFFKILETNKYSSHIILIINIAILRHTTIIFKLKRKEKMKKINVKVMLNIALFHCYITL